MAIYHCSVKTITRRTGRSATGAAAYRAGQTITDERSGLTHDYSRRSGVVETAILLPAGSPAILSDRSTLWNAAEKAERRKDATVARELVLALPHELDAAGKKELALGMGQFLVSRYGTAVDVAIHEASGKDGHDFRNDHAHLLFTTREISEQGLGANPPYRQAIRNFDPLKSQAEKSENKSWLTRGSDKTKPMTDMINSKMTEIRKDQPQAPNQPHDLSRLKGAFNFNAENTKRTTYEAHRAKTRAEADMKRAQMPPEYRAKPYDSEPQAQSGIKGVQDALKSKWEGFRAGSQNPPQPEKTRVKMSDTFNRGSFEGVESGETPDYSVDDDPDIGSPS